MSETYESVGYALRCGACHIQNQKRGQASADLLAYVALMRMDADSSGFWLVREVVKHADGWDEEDVGPDFEAEVGGRAGFRLDGLTVIAHSFRCRKGHNPQLTRERFEKLAAETYAKGTSQRIVDRTYRRRSRGSRHLPRRTPRAPRLRG